MGKISNLPISITIDIVHFESALYPEKLNAGPTKLNPGPTLPIQVSDAEKWVNISEDAKVSSERINVLKIKIASHKIIYVLAFLSVSGVKISPSSFFVKTVLGCTIFLISDELDLNKIKNLEIFTPPPVDPPQAPIIIRKRITACDSAGHIV